MNPVYGPVPSWRLGASLGIDPVCANICTFDCIYCQLGPTRLKSVQRKKFVEPAAVKARLEAALEKSSPDIITFSGMGEPTLASNLGEIADAVKAVTDLPMAILTNSSFLRLEETRNALSLFDLVISKLDAPNQEVFEKVNRPASGITFEDIVEGIQSLENDFALQVMFVEQNKAYAQEIASLVADLEPKLVYLDTPIRPCACKPLPEAEMQQIKREFSGVRVSMVYDAKKPSVTPLDMHETLLRRPVL